MIDYYLKFPDEATANAVLNTTVDEVRDELGSIFVEASTIPKYVNTSIIGTISKPTGETDDEGNAVMAALDGWHVNVKADESPELVQYQIFPVMPVRVWAS
jgi:hypothetical protein